MPVELSFDGVVWGLANGEVRIPIRGEEGAIGRFLAQGRQIAAAQRTTTPSAAYLRFAVDSEVVVVNGVTAHARPVVEAILTAAATSTL